MKTKQISFSRLKKLSHELHRAKKKIVFTNGTFDLIHLGHVDYLQKARKLGHVLVVGVNSDRSVKAYKSPFRPIIPLQDRVKVLSALSCIDYIVVFEDPTPLKVILNLRPDILAKGADWKINEIAGAREVFSWGGKVKLLPLVLGRSTTAIIQKIRNAKKA